MRLGCTHAQERSERYMGRVEEVLVEERNPKNAAQVCACAFAGVGLVVRSTAKEMTKKDAFDFFVPLL